MGKWGELARQTYLDIKIQHLKNMKQADKDCTAVVIDNIYRIKKRTRRR